jgi:hypothetical protein
MALAMRNWDMPQAQATSAAATSASDATIAEHWNSALRYRNRAEELRIKAEQMKNEHARASLLKLAAELDEMANFHEEFVAAKALNAAPRR